METIIDNALVEVARETEDFGAGRTLDRIARLIDFGDDWETIDADTSDYGKPEARYAIETQGEITTYGAGGAILSCNPDGDAELVWIDEPPANLVQYLRDDWAEFGRDPFADTDEG